MLDLNKINYETLALICSLIIICTLVLMGFVGPEYTLGQVICSIVIVLVEAIATFIMLVCKDELSKKK